MSFTGLLNQTISVYNRTTRDLHGKLSFGTAASVSARVERKYGLTIITKENDKEPIDAVVFVPAGTAVENSDKIVYDSQTYRVVKRLDQVGRGGDIHHVELFIQRWNF